jgi:hypothetical protein
MKKPLCSPYSKLHNSNTSTCITHDNLLILKHYWDMRHPDNKINSTNNREIWEELNSYMKLYLCENEKCWMRKLITDNEIIDDIFHESFAPTMPTSWIQTPHKWLSDLDISKVMKQYETAYKDFNFIGPSPIDYNVFDETKKNWVWPELKNFSLRRYIEKQPTSCGYIGVVFNLDTHRGEGTHWVSLFININTSRIYYFDSNGNSVPNNIRKLVKCIKEQGRELGLNFKFSANYPNIHQKKNSECGVYVLYFLINMLTNDNWNIFKNDRISDEEIFKYREKFFDNSE